MQGSTRPHGTRTSTICGRSALPPASNTSAAPIAAQDDARISAHDGPRALDRTLQLAGQDLRTLLPPQNCTLDATLDSSIGERSALSTQLANAGTNSPSTRVPDPHLDCILTRVAKCSPCSGFCFVILIARGDWYRDPGHRFFEVLREWWGSWMETATINTELFVCCYFKFGS